jgi:type II secretory pathway predicted ATPase ExeA
MYESFYGLSGKPFSLLPDADFLFFSKRHKRLLNLLEYSAVTQAGFVVISGDVGAGKTTALRHYLKRLGKDATVGSITNSSKSLGRLLGWVATAFELEFAGMDDIQIYNRFVEFLISQYSRGKRTILIIDEAQNMTADMLEDLRMLSNVNNEKDQLLQIILAGQPSLLNTLKHPDLHQFVQRISIHYHLTPLDPHETAAYIHHRLAVVGGSPALFNDTACAAVHFFTGGVPRLINLLCDQSLMYAFAEDSDSVKFQTVVEVVNDRGASGLSAFRNVATDRTDESLLSELQEILDKIRAAHKESI